MPLAGYSCQTGSESSQWQQRNCPWKTHWILTWPWMTRILGTWFASVHCHLARMSKSRVLRRRWSSCWRSASLGLPLKCQWIWNCGVAVWLGSLHWCPVWSWLLLWPCLSPVAEKKTILVLQLLILNFNLKYHKYLTSTIQNIQT